MNALPMPHLVDPRKTIILGLREIREHFEARRSPELYAVVEFVVAGRPEPLVSPMIVELPELADFIDVKPKLLRAALAAPSVILDLYRYGGVVVMLDVDLDLVSLCARPEFEFVTHYNSGPFIEPGEQLRARGRLRQRAGELGVALYDLALAERDQHGRSAELDVDIATLMRAPVIGAIDPAIRWPTVGRLVDGCGQSALEALADPVLADALGAENVHMVAQGDRVRLRYQRRREYRSEALRAAA